MPRPKLNVTLRQMLTYATEAAEMAAQLSRIDLDVDLIRTRALVHTMELIGETASRVAEEDREKYPGIPWQDIVDLRNRLIHGYDRIDYDTLLQIVQHDLPALMAELRLIMPKL